MHLANASRSFHEGHPGGSARPSNVAQKSKQACASRCPSCSPRMTAPPNALRRHILSVLISVLLSLLANAIITPPEDRQ